MFVPTVYIPTKEGNASRNICLLWNICVWKKLKTAAFYFSIFGRLWFRNTDCLGLALGNDKETHTKKKLLWSTHFCCRVTVQSTHTFTSPIAICHSSFTAHKTIVVCNDPLSCYSWLIPFYHPWGVLFCQPDQDCAVSRIRQTNPDKES